MVKCPKCGIDLVLTGKIGMKQDVEPSRGVEEAETEVYSCANKQCDLYEKAVFYDKDSSTIYDSLANYVKGIGYS